MLVAQNSLGPVCPVPLTVRGIGPAGDALYVATDPNHRTVHRFDAAGKLVRAERCADEAPNYLLCV